MHIMTQMTVASSKALIEALAEANGWHLSLTDRCHMFTVYDISPDFSTRKWYRFQLDDENGDLVERWEGPAYHAVRDNLTQETT